MSGSERSWEGLGRADSGKARHRSAQQAAGLCPVLGSEGQAGAAAQVSQNQ